MTDADDVQDKLDRLESIVDDQQARIDDQAETIERQQATIAAQTERLEAVESHLRTLVEGAADDGTAADGPAADEDPDETDGDTDENTLLTRRNALTAAGTLALLGGGAGTASADPTGRVGKPGRPVRNVHTERLAGGLTGGTSIGDLFGIGLTTEAATSGTDVALSAEPAANDHVDVVGDFGFEVENVDTFELAGALSAEEREDGVVELDAADDAILQPSVTDDGTTVADRVASLDFGSNLSVTPSGDGVTVTADVQQATNWAEADADDLLEPKSPFTGVDVANVRTGSLNGGVTGGTDLTSLTGNGVTISGTSLGIASGGVGSTELVNDSVTVAGRSVSLGGSTGIAHEDLDSVGTDDHHAKNHDHTETRVSPVPNAGLVNDSVEVNPGNGLTSGGSVPLGGATTIDIASSGVGTGELADDAVRSNKIAAGAVGAIQIRDDIFLDVTDGTLETSTLKNLQGDINVGANLIPELDDSVGLGKDGKRFVNLWAADGTINTSDARLKENVSKLSDGLARLRELRPVTYEWGNRANTTPRIGLIAQEVEDVIPEAVENPDGEEGYLGLNYEMVIPVAVDAIQAQQAEIEQEDERIDDLEAENERLRERNEILETRLDRVEAHLDLDTPVRAPTDD